MTPPVPSTPWEMIATAVAGLIGITGLWRWLAARLDRESARLVALEAAQDAEIQSLRVRLEEAMERMSVLSGRLSAAEARAAAAEARAATAERRASTAERRALRADRKILMLGGEPSEAEEDSQ